jgi:spore germination protein KA
LTLWKQIKRFFIPDLTTTRDPFSVGQWQKPVDDDPPATASAPDSLPPAYAGSIAGEQVSPDLQANLRRLRAHFSVPRNQGLTTHTIMLPTAPPRQAAIVYLQGIVDGLRLDFGILQPLLDEERVRHAGAAPAALFHQVLQEGQGDLRRELADLVNDLLQGSTAVLVDGEAEAATVRIEGWTRRQPDRPQTEVTVRGSQESFTEDLRSNISQVRRRLRTPDVMVELGSLGKYSRTAIAVVYLRGVANEKLVGEVRRRLAGIDVDYVADSGSIEQFIEDRPYAIFPTVLSTERPDRVAAQVAQGFVAILIDNDPHALIVPVNMPTLLHSAEDYYLRWPSGTFMRFTRLAAYYVSILMPALYIALVNYRQEMIPTPLLLSIAHSRETVPFSAVIEVLLLESAFELIHEATLRVPTVVGPTIGIVGSLILGQAAVQAGVISPILVIITAATALAAFAIPDYQAQMGVRVWKFLYIGAASLLGLTGLVMLHTAYVCHLSEVRSFGSPYLAPLTPVGGLTDSLVLTPVFKRQKRPSFLKPQDRQRQDRVTRPWWPEAPQDSGQKGSDPDERT